MSYEELAAMQHTRDEINGSGRRGGAAKARSNRNAARRRPRSRKTCLPDSQADEWAAGASGGVKFPLKTTRELTLEIAAKEYVWLWDRRHGSSLEAIAAREGVSIGRVRFGLARARAQEKDTVTTRVPRPPRLVPLFPIGAYTPRSTCAHRRPIETGSSLCCMVCHTSGMDRHPALRRDARSDPAPEPKPKPVPESAIPSRETRKVRRQRLFAPRV
jgi:hypothetical protein